MSVLFELPEKPEKAEIKDRLRTRRDNLFAKQMIIKDKKIPVLFCVSQMGEERTQQESSPQSIIPSIRPTR